MKMNQQNTPPRFPEEPIDDVFNEQDDVVVALDEVEEWIDELLGEDAHVQNLEMEGGHGDSDDTVSSPEPEREHARLIFKKHTGPIFCGQIEPKSGVLAVTGSQDDKAFVWNIQTGEVDMECKNHHDSVICAGFNHDGSYVATGDMKGIVQVWKLSNKSKIWDTNIGDLSWMKWHQSANVLFGGTDTGEVYVWRIPGGDCKILPGHGCKTECGIILPDGKRIAVGYNDGTIKIFDIKSTTALHTLNPGKVHEGNVTCMATHFDNNLVMTGGTDGIFSVFSSQTGNVIFKADVKVSHEEDDGSMSEENSSVESVVFNKFGNLQLAMVGTGQGIISVWDISKQTKRHQFNSEGGGIVKMLLEDVNPRLYAACMDNTIKVFDVIRGREVDVMRGHDDYLLDISLSPDCSVILSTSEDGTARIFGVNDPREL